MTENPEGPTPDEEVEALRARLEQADPADVIANHAYGLFELAAVYLSATPPRLESAQVAIDALSGLLGAVDGRLGEADAPLKEGLAQIRLAWVQVTAAQENQA
jgi:hypothetical protein